MNKNIGKTGIILTPISEEHIHSLFSIWSSPAVTKYMNIEPLQSEDEAKMMIHYFMKHRLLGEASRYAVIYQNEVIGTCGYNYYEEYNERVEIGYELAEQFWGKGFGKDMVYLLSQYAFESLSCKRIEAIVHPDNIRSCRLLESLGFIREARLHKYERMVNNELGDVLLYAKIKD